MFARFFVLLDAADCTCSVGWWRSSCSWPTWPPLTASTADSPRWRCCAGTLRPKPKCWTSCRSSATSWDSPSTCRRRGPCTCVSAVFQQRVTVKAFSRFSLSACGRFDMFSPPQKSLNATVGEDKYSSARKEVLTHMCSRPMQVRARQRARRRRRGLRGGPELSLCSPVPDGALLLRRILQRGEAV